MSSDRKRILRDYRTDAPDMRVRVEVYYSKGSLEMSRGYWLNIYPYRVEGGMMIATLGAGSRRLIAHARRFSAKGLAGAAVCADTWLLQNDPGVRQQIAACGEVLK